MTSLVLLAALSLTSSPTDGVEREVTYAGALFGADPLPKFDKGYLLFLKRTCQFTVYSPAGAQLFSRQVSGPAGSSTCSALDAAVDADGAVAVSISCGSPNGYAAGIVMLDPKGNPTGFEDTKRYMPSHICFDRQHAIWSIGWQRDEFRNDAADEKEYMIVRRYSRSGGETGSYLPRSLWGRKGEPGLSGLGLWHIAAADEQIGAVVNEDELVEWDLQGKLVSRTPIRVRLDGGWAYTSNGELFGQVREDDGRGLRLVRLDRGSLSWTPAGASDARLRLLLGADGGDLIFQASGGGSARLLWVRPRP
jgi:hypothetical protein